MRFDRFTERAQDAAQRAYEILQRYGHNQVDTEHILLALLEQPDGLIPQILEKLKVDTRLLQSRLDDVLRASPKATIYGGGGAGQVFITPRVKLATSAFGAGVDASNVRGILHTSLPESLVQYAQETARGGRDGKRAVCVVGSDGQQHSWREQHFCDVSLPSVSGPAHIKHACAESSPTMRPFLPC